MLKCREPLTRLSASCWTMTIIFHYFFCSSEFMYKRSDFQWLGRIFRWLANDWNSKRRVSAVGGPLRVHDGVAQGEGLVDEKWSAYLFSVFACKTQGFCGFACVLLKSSSFDAFITIAYWCRTELACARFAYQKKILLWTFIPSQSLHFNCDDSYFISTTAVHSSCSDSALQSNINWSSSLFARKLANFFHHVQLFLCRRI